MAGAHSWGTSRTRVFELIRSSRTALSAHAIAEQANLHANTARFHLERLAGDGLVDRTTSKDGTGRGRPTVLYSVAASATANQGSEYRLLAEILAGSLADSSTDAAGAATAAGAAWGAYVAKPAAPYRKISQTEARGQLVDMLETHGFAPERADDDEQISIRRCPFAAVQQHHGEVICSVHLGLMRGLLDELDAGLEVDRLEPHVQPDLCVAHLRHQSAHHGDPPESLAT
ncbi:MAG TPA: hypothetical protein VK053_11820 [Jiangellaceae bacterium]|nr:hypothetical protein [Jiangellaceae bacterium]